MFAPDPNAPTGGPFAHASAALLAAFVATLDTTSATVARPPAPRVDPLEWGPPPLEYFEPARPVQGFGGIACIGPAPHPRAPRRPVITRPRLYRVQSRA